MISRGLKRCLQNSLPLTKHHPLDLYRPLVSSSSQLSHFPQPGFKLLSAEHKPSLNPIKTSYLYMDSSPSARLDIEEIRLKAHKLCDVHLGGPWSKVDVGDFSVIPVRDLGPKIYGSFDGGRLEEFLPANSLTSDELVDSEISAIIAAKLAAIHDLDLGRLDNLDNRWLVNRLSDWSELVMEEVHTSSNNNNNNNDKLSPVCSIADELLAIDYKKEVDFLKSILRNIKSPQVFSHNDLHQGNILLTTHSEQRTTLEERVIIIDFEYCSYNYRAFDIANHFTEWCFEYDIEQFPHFNFDKSRFPSLDTQRRFARHYLDQAARLETSKKAGHATNGCKQQNEQPTCQADVEDLVNEVKPFLMASNLMWALWCIRSARRSGIKFGYWEHAKARWQLYSEFKLNYINETPASLHKTTSNKKGCSVVQNGSGAGHSAAAFCKETAASE